MSSDMNEQHCTDNDAYGKQNQDLRRLGYGSFHAQQKTTVVFPAHPLLWHRAPQHFISERRQLWTNTNVRRAVINNLEARNCQLQSNYDLSWN